MIVFISKDGISAYNGSDTETQGWLSVIIKAAQLVERAARKFG